MAITITLILIGLLVWFLLDGEAEPKEVFITLGVVFVVLVGLSQLFGWN